MHKKTILSLLEVGVVTTGAIAAWITFFDFQKNKNIKNDQIISRYNDFNNAFNKHKDLILLNNSKNNSIIQKISELESRIFDSTISPLEKWKALNKLGDLQNNVIFDWVSELIKNEALTNSAVRKLEELLVSQSNRIQEKDIKSQFKYNEVTNLKLALKNFENLQKSKQEEFINLYKEFFNNKIKEQYQLVEKYLMQKDNSLDDNIIKANYLMPTKSLRYKFDSISQQIEWMLFEPSFRINDIAKNKEFIEEIIVDYSKNFNQAIIDKFNSASSEMNEIVNSDSQNVINIIANAILKSLPNDSKYIWTVKQLKNSVDINKLPIFNRKIFDQLINIAKNAKIFSKNELNTLLNHKQVYAYDKISEYFLTGIKYKLDSSISIEDIEDALANLKTFKIMTLDSELTNEKIIKEFIKFVQLQKNEINLGKEILNKIFDNSSYKEIVNATKFDKFNKSVLTTAISKYRNDINTIKNAERNALRLKKLVLEILNDNNKLISVDEAHQYNDEIDKIFNNSTNTVFDVVSKLHEVEKTFQSMIISRYELRKIQNEIEEDILKLNNFNEEIINEYLSKNAKQLATNLLNEITIFFQKDKFKINKITENKLINSEKLRDIEKIVLDHLEKTTKANFDKLYEDYKIQFLSLPKNVQNELQDKYINVDILKKIVDEINIETRKITSKKFNPIISKDLLEQIKKYKFIVNLLSVSQKQNESILSLEKSKQYAETAFNPTKEISHKYSANAQLHINKIISKQNDLKNNANNINNLLNLFISKTTLSNVDKQKIENSEILNSFESLESYNKVNEFIKSNQQTAKAIEQADKSIDQIDKLFIEITKEYGNLDDFLEEKEQIEKIKQEIYKELENNANVEKINKLTQQIQNIFNKTAAKKKEGSIAVKIKKINEKINNVFPNNDNKEQSVGEKNLRERLSKILKESEKPGLTKEKKLELLNEAESLNGIIEKVKEFEENIDSFNKKSDEYRDDSEILTRVPESIATTNDKTINQMKLLINEIIIAEEIPTIDKFQNKINELNQRKQDLEISYNKDKLETLTRNLETKKYNLDDDKTDATKLQFDKAIEDITHYAKEKLNSESLVDLQNTRTLVLKQNELIDTLNKAISEKEAINSDTGLKEEIKGKNVADLDEIIKNNMPNLTSEPIDSTQLIETKISNVKNAIKESKEKHELSKLIESDLKLILNDKEKVNKALATVNAELEKQIANNEAIINAKLGTYSEDTIKQAKKSLEQAIKKMKDEKARLLKEFDEVKIATDDILRTIEERVASDLENNNQFKFENFDKVKKEYQALLENSLGANIEDLKQKQLELKQAYQKDRAFNAAIKYKKFIEDEITSKTTNIPEINKLAESFKDQIEKRLKESFSTNDANNFINLIQTMTSFNDVQKDIHDFIKDLEEKQKNNSDMIEAETAIKEAKKLFSQKFIPVAPYAKEDIDNKQKILLVELKKIDEKQTKKSENKILINKIFNSIDNFRSNPELELEDSQNNDRALVNKVLNEILQKDVDLGISVDPNVSKIVEEKLNKIKEENKKAETIEEVKKIEQKLKAIEEIKPYINALALEIGSSLYFISNNDAENDPLVRSFIDNELKVLINESRDLYINNFDGQDTEEIAKKSIEAIKQSIIKIENSKENIKKTKEIKSQLLKAQELNLNTNYFSVNNQTADYKKDIIKKWLDNIATTSNYDKNITDNQQRLDYTYEKINAAYDLIAKIKEISNEIEKWKRERSLKSDILEQTEKDEELLTQSMWDAVPSSASNNLSTEEIRKKIETLNQNYLEKSEIRNQRVKLLIDIKDFEITEAFLSLDSNPVLKEIVLKRIKKIGSKILDAKNFNQIKDINDQFTRLKELLVEEIKLAEKINSSKQYISTLDLDSEVSNKKDEFVLKIQESNNWLEKETPETAEELETRKNNLAKQIDILDLHKSRLDVFKSWTNIKEKVETSTILSTEKNALLNKMKTFAQEINSVKFNDDTKALEFENVGNKWLKGQTETSIPYLLQEAINFQESLNNAKNVNATSTPLNGQDVTSAKIKAAYDLLINDITDAEDLIKNAESATLLKRKEITNNFSSHIDQIVSAKKEAMEILASKSKELYNELIKDDNLRNNEELTEFKKVSIDNLKSYNLPISDNKKEIIETIDKLIIDARDNYLLQIKEIYNKQNEVISQTLNDLNEYSVAILSDNIWIKETKTKFDLLKESINKINIFIKNNIYDEKRLSEFANFENQNNYIEQYYIENNKLVNEANKSKNNFIESISNNIKEILGENNGKIGTLIKSIDNSININSDSINSLSNLFEKLGLSEIKIDFENLKKEHERLKAILTNLNSESENKANKLAENITNVNKHINNFDIFVEKLKVNITNLIENRSNINEILNGVLKSPTGDDKNNIVAEYDKKHNLVKTILDQLQKVELSEFVKSSFINIDSNTISNLLTNLNTFYDFVNDTEFNKFFINSINSDIKTKEKYTLEDFKEKLEEITKDINGKKEIDITNNDLLLPMFEMFGNTQIDLENKFNPVNVRTYLVIDNDTSKWFTEMNANESQKTIKLKLRYEYKPSSLFIFSNYKGFSHEISKDISFTTDKKISLKPKSKDIFYKDYKQDSIGKNAKQKIANTERLGWVVSNKEEAIKKFIEKFKKASKFGDSSEVIIDSINNKIYKINNNSIIGTEELNSDFKLKFILPQVFIYQQSTQVKGDTSKQFIRLKFEEEKRLVAEIASPAQLVVGSLNYQANKNTIELINGVPDQKLSMPTALLTTIKFEFDWDDATKDLSMFITRYETYHVAKHKQLKATEEQKKWINDEFKYTTHEGNYDAYVWSSDNFAKWLILNNQIWKTPEGNNSNPPIYTRDTNPNNDYPGEEKDNKIIVKNPRFTGVYIRTESNGNQVSATGPDAMNIYNSGIEFFELTDIKNE
ncbi:hypothetical protein [Metamycoplasma canadense]|uniref:Uncharacterized protein n=1 Tax=Metamycoplasma canadense TaxID=29554 RepID=A0A077L5L6_9BACT|nr:hypothetical protein [Metamycoplasma canadense]BAP39570.1 hypothetical protein MCAN360_0413 [Metamycoplasma canadense]